MNDRTEIQALTGLRGLAALWVYIFHAGGFLLWQDPTGVIYAIGPAGYLGVDVFFVLSGFVLAHNYAGAGLHASAAGWARFLWKRLARIYPAHLAALGLLVALASMQGGIPWGSERFTIERLIQTLTLTHAWSVPVDKMWNVVSWSISAEWAAYLAFPVLAVMASRLKTRRASIGAIALLFAALCSQTYFGAHPGTMAYGMQRIAAEFTVGVLLCQIARHHASPGTAWDRIAIEAFAVLVIGANLLDHQIRPGIALSFLPAMAAIGVFALALARGPAQRFLSRPVCLYAGRISYSFYLVHLLLLSFVGGVMRELGLEADPGAMLAALGVTFVVTLGVSHAFYSWIEEPARGRMLSLSAGTRSRPILATTRGEN